MPRKRPSLKQDENERAHKLVQAMIGEGPRPEPPGKREKDPEAVKRGRKGGKARAETVTPDELVEIAKKGAATRWAGRAKKKGPTARPGRSR